MATWLNKWRLAAIILVLAYVIGVVRVFPLASLSITSVNYPTNHTYFNDNGVLVTLNLTNLIGRNHFDVGDIAVFTFNIINTHNFTVNSNFNSSMTYSQYGYPQTFTLNPNQSENITEELPVNTQGSNGFLFALTSIYDNGNAIDTISIPFSKCG